MKNIDSFEFLFENAPLPYQSLDKNGNIIMVNKAWLEVLGYKKDEVIGKWFGDFLPSKSIDVFKGCFSELRAAGKILNNEIEINRKDGVSILASFNGIIVCDDKGEIMRTDCIFMDITERKKMEEAIAESEKNLDLAQEVGEIGSYVVGIPFEFFVEKWVRRLHLDFMMANQLLVAEK